LEIKVYKSTKLLEVWENGTLTKTYEIAIGKSKVGHKEVEGDQKTPEGKYKVVIKNPNSKFHLSFGINYPNSHDAKFALDREVISADECHKICEAEEKGEIPPWKTILGGEIYIHGNLEKQRWTEGCVRMFDKDIEELYEKIEIGTSVIIYP